MLESNNEPPRLYFWKNINYLAVLSCNIILYFVLLSALVPTPDIGNIPLSIMKILDRAQVIGFYPIFFDALLFFYVIIILRWSYKKGFFKRMISLHFSSSTFSKILIANIIYLLLLGFFVQNFNPIGIINIFQGSVHFFTWLVFLSLIIQIIAFRINQLKRDISLITLLLTFNFYLVFAFLIYALFISSQDINNFSYFFPFLVFVNIQTLVYDYAKSIMTKSEFTSFINHTIIPVNILIESGIFADEQEYKEAMAVGAKNIDQLNLVKSYDADSYETAIKIRDSNFPSMIDYNKAQALGMNNYIELQKYEQKQMIVELKEKIQRKKRIRFNEQQINLINLLKKTNRIKLDHLIDYLNIPNTKYLLVWLSNLPDDHPVKLEGDSLALNPHISERQLKSFIENLLLQLDAKFTITQDDVKKVKDFFSDLRPNIRITMKQLEKTVDLTDEKIDYIILFLLSKVPKFVNYNVEEEYFVRRDFDIDVGIADFPEFIEDMSNF